MSSHSRALRSSASRAHAHMSSHAALDAAAASSSPSAPPHHSQPCAGAAGSTTAAARVAAASPAAAPSTHEQTDEMSRSALPARK